MEEIINIFIEQKETIIYDYIKCLHKKHEIIPNISKNENIKFIQDILSTLNNSRENFSSETWKSLLEITYLYAISTFLDIDFQLDTTTSLTFSITLINLSKIKEQHEMYNILMPIYQKSLNIVKNGSGDKGYFSITPLHPYLISFSMLKEIMPLLSINEKKSFFEAIVNIEYNHDFISFYTDLLKNYMSNNAMYSLKDIFDKLNAFAQKDPSLFIYNFFFMWFWYYQKDLKSLSDQSDTLSSYLNQISYCRYHVINRKYKWFSFIRLFIILNKAQIENKLRCQERVLSLICNGFRVIPNFDSEINMKDQLISLMKICANEFSNGNTWLIDYIYNNINLLVWKVKAKIGKITGIKFTDTRNPPYLNDIKVYFSQQESSNHKLDSEIYSIYHVYEIKNPKEGYQIFQKQTKIIDFVNSHIYTCSFIHISLFQFIANNDYSDLLCFYVLNFFEICFDFLISLSYFQSILLTFNDKRLILNPELPKKFHEYFKKISNIVNIQSLFTNILKFIDRLSIDYYSSVAEVVSKRMFESLRKGKLTLNFIKNFKFFPSKIDNENYKTNFFTYLLGKMFEIAINNIRLYDSKSDKQASLIYKWVLLTIRFGLINTELNSNFILGLYLQNYHMIFTYSILMNIKKAVHQVYMIKTISIYLEELKKNYQKLTKNSESDAHKREKKQQIKLFSIDDIQDNAKIESINTILTLYIENPTLLDFNYIVQFLEKALISKIPNLLEKAAKIFIYKFKEYKSDDVSRYYTIFNLMFDVLPLIDIKYSKKIFKSLSLFSSLFLPHSKNKFYSCHSIEIDELGFNMEHVLNEVAKHMENYDALAIFNLTTICFETILNNIGCSHFIYKNALYTLIKLLCYSWCFSSVESRVKTYYIDLVSKFGDAFISGKSNLFILSLFNVAGCGKSQFSKNALILAKSFFDYIKEKQFDKEILNKTINQFISFFPKSTSLYSMLFGFYTIIKYFPQYVRLDHIRSFLIQTTDVQPNDKEFGTLLNSMLKLYLSKLDRKHKENFVQMTFDISCSLSIVVRLVLMKRARKLKIPLPYNSFSEIEQCHTSDLYLHRLSLIFLYGLQTDFEFNQQIYDKISEIIKQPNTIDKYIRCLCFILSIFKSPKIFHMYQPQSFSQLKKILINAIISKYKPIVRLVKKCMKNLKKYSKTDRYYDDFISSLLKYMDTNIGKFSELIGMKFQKYDIEHEHRINEAQLYSDKKNFIFIDLFYLLINFFPDNYDILSNDYVSTLIHGMNDYVKQSNSEMMIYLPIFVNILKFFAIKDFIISPKNKNILFEQNNGTNIFETYIHNIIKLYKVREISFPLITHKYVEKFLILFPNETIDYVFNKENDSCMVVFVEKLILDDKTNVFFQSFKDHLIYLKGLKNIEEINPFVFKLVFKLTKIKRFITKDLLDILSDHFDKLIDNKETISTKTYNFSLLSYLLKAMINLINYYPSTNMINSISRIFTYTSFFSYSYIQDIFIKKIFNESKITIVYEVLEYIKNNICELSPFLLDVFLPRISKIIDNDEKIQLLKLIIQWVPLYPKFLFVFLHSFLKIVKSVIPNINILSTIIEIAKNVLLKPDTQAIIYSLKIFIYLSTNNLIPNELYFMIFSLLLKSTYFSESPYLEYFIELLECRQDLLENFPPKYLSIFHFYIHKIFYYSIDLKKILFPATSILIAVPILNNYLPFSLLNTVSIFLNKKLMAGIKHPNEEIEMINLFTLSLKYCRAVQLKISELNFWTKVCFRFIKMFSFSKLKDDFLETFYSLLINNDITTFPTDLLNAISSSNGLDSNKFKFTSVAAKINSKIFFKSYTDILLEKYFRFVESNDDELNVKYFNVLITALNKEQVKPYQIDKFLQRTYNKLIEKFEDSNKLLRLKISPYITEISRYYLMNGSTESISLLMNFDIKILNEVILKFLYESIINVPLENQFKYAQIILNKIKDDDVAFFCLIESLQTILTSPKLTKSTVVLLLRILIKFSLTFEKIDVQKIINIVQNLNTESIYIDYLIQFHLIQVSKTKSSSFITCLLNVISLLPRNEKECAEYLIETLPIEFWKNEFLPIIVAILSPKMKTWEPLFSLCHSLSNISDELIQKIFIKLIDHKNINIFIQLLENSLKYESKISHNQIISGLIKTFYFAKIRIPYQLAEKAIKRTGKYHFLYFFLSEDSIPSNSLLFPNVHNITIYNIYQSRLNSIQASAILMTFLSQYDAAESIYNHVHHKTPFMEAMSKINNNMILRVNCGVDKILQPLNKINKMNFIVTMFDSAIKFYKANDEEKLKEEIERIERSYFQSIIRKKNIHLFEKESSALIQSIIHLLLKNTTIKSDLSFVNQSFKSIYKYIKRYINDKEINPKFVVEEVDSISILSPSMTTEFPKISGYTSLGLIAIGEKHVDEYFNKISMKLNKGNMKLKDWSKFASFTFSMYCITQSIESFSSSYYSYAKVFNNGQALPQYIIQEAAARIITLTRIAIHSKNELYYYTIKENSSLFGIKNGKIWQMWLHELVECASENFFYEISKELFQQMPYRSLLYCKKEKNKYIENLLLQYLHLNPSPQISIMEISEKFLNDSFNINFKEKRIQTDLYKFIQETIKLTDEEINKIDLLSCRKEYNIKIFHKVLNELTLTQIQKIGNYQEFARKVKSFNENELYKFIQEFTGSSKSLKDIKQEISEIVQRTNEKLPFIIPLHLEEQERISILQIHDDFEVISSDIILFRMVSTNREWPYFWVQKSRNQNGFNKSIISLGTTIYLLRVLLQQNYLTRKESINVFPSKFFEIGDKYIFAPLTSHPYNLEHIFKHSTLTTSEEWIYKYCKQKNSSKIINPSNGYYNQNLELTEEGLENIKTFPKDAIKKAFLTRASQEEYLLFIPSVSKSLSTSYLFYYLFNGIYPKMEYTILCATSSVFPFLHIDFDHGMITSEEKQSFSSIRLSPNICEVLGNFQGNLMLIIGSIAEGFIKNIGTIQSYLEILIGDEDYDHELMQDVDKLIKKRNNLENKLIEISPPRVPNIPPEEGEKWIKNIESCIKKAMDPNIQPIECIPWF